MRIIFFNGLRLEQAGDSAILVEYGPMNLDFALRARIHAFESGVCKKNVTGIRAFSPCIRSTMVSVTQYFHLQNYDAFDLVSL